MKKILVAAILGTVAATSALAQGHINLNPYNIAPYNQVFWATGALAPNAVHAADGVQLQFFYALGTVADPLQLTTSATGLFTVNSNNYNPSLGHGGGGYFNIQDLVFPTWSSGSVTVMLVASGSGVDPSSHSALWQIPGSGGNGIVSTAVPANQANFFPGLGVTAVPVPEPTTFALSGLGAAAMLIFRRRK